MATWTIKSERQFVANKHNHGAMKCLFRHKLLSFLAILCALEGIILLRHDRKFEPSYAAKFDELLFSLFIVNRSKHHPVLLSDVQPKQTIDIDSERVDIGSTGISRNSSNKQIDNRLVKTLLTRTLTSQEKWWKTQADAIALPFPTWPRETKYTWCLQHYFPKKSGLLFHKLFKTGSSTAASVHLRVAHKVGERKNFSSPCAVFYKHSFSLQNDQRYRKKSRSFLWTILREPTARSVSSYFFYRIGLNGEDFSDESMISYLEATKNIQLVQVRDDMYKTSLEVKGGILQNLGGLDPRQLESPMETVGQQLIQLQVLKAYNFIAILERWDESMVVLQLLLDLEDEDVIVLSSKSAGDWSWNWTSGENSTCFRIPKPTIPRQVKDYLQHNFTRGNNDFLLYAAANRSLDLTIDKLGRRRVEAMVERHKSLKQLVEEKCRDQVIYPCSKDGHWQAEAYSECYWRDMGCGFKCVDQVLDEARRSGE